MASTRTIHDKSIKKLTPGDPKVARCVKRPPDRRAVRLHSRTAVATPSRADDTLMSSEQPTKRMALRYAGTCTSCGSRIAAGERAVYFKATRQVECLLCHQGAPDSAQAPQDSKLPMPGGTTSRESIPVNVGVAGASARREHERRVAKREERIRAAHPKIGRLLLAITDEPQSTRAWDIGSAGEVKLGKRLNGLADRGVLVLHDRRIPGTPANIDHIAISSAGVFVIDAKRYQGRPSLKAEGGILRPRTETLMVGRRDCTKLLNGITKQVGLVTAAMASTPGGLGDVPVHGMLCFVEADWPLFGGSFTIDGIEVLWPAKAAEKITASGPITSDRAEALHRHLAHAFPIA